MIVKTFSSTPASLFLCVEFDTIWSAYRFSFQTLKEMNQLLGSPQLYPWIALNCFLSLDSRQSCKDALHFLRPTLPHKLSSLNVFKLPVVHCAMHITFVATRKLGTTSALFLAWFNTNKREEFQVCNESSSWKEWIRNLEEETRGDRLHTLVLLS